MARLSQQAQIQILNQLHCNHSAAVVEQDRCSQLIKRNTKWSRCWKGHFGRFFGREILQMRGAYQIWNNTTEYESYFEFFLLMKHEPADGKLLERSTFGLCDDMRTVESRRAEPQGSNKILC